MEIAQVIAVRDALKAGKNLPLTIYIDNAFRIINENNVFQFTKWDDNNGVLYNYALSDPNITNSPSNIGGEMSLFAVSYESIQAMEVTKLPFNELPNSIDSLNNSGAKISAEWKERIINRFKAALNPNLVNMSPTDINVAMGVIDGQKAVNDNDDYYNGKFTESFAETRPMAAHNEYANKVAKENKD